MTNFDRFLTDSQFTSFAEVAVSAEKIYPIDPAACVLNCRRSMEFAVKWMYSVDNELVMPYDDRLVSLMDAEDFRDIVGEDLWRRLKRRATVPLDEAQAVAVLPPKVETVWETVKTLKPMDRGALYLFYYEGYSTGEIAQMLRVSQSSVTSRLSRARKRLRTELEVYHG